MTAPIVVEVDVPLVPGMRLEGRCGGGLVRVDFVVGATEKGDFFVFSNAHLVPLHDLLGKLIAQRSGT